jgi:hypothetical protein
MQIDPQEYLDLVEQTGKLIFVDIESTGLKGDYNTVLVVSIKPYGKKPFSFSVPKVSRDYKVVRDAKDALEMAGAWVTYYGKGFDIPMLNTRLLRHGLNPIEKRPHLDMYFTLKSNILTGRKSQSHLLSWLGTPEQKMSVSADTWADMSASFERNMPIMIRRCESDVAGLEALYRKTRHLVREITR